MEKTSPCISAYSQIGNSQDSESFHSHSDQSDNAIKKRKRAPHSHKLSNKRRGDGINKRLRALRSLIPNCTKMDKESVLDEAIVYLKCLQLQLQIMPTFAGLCVPPSPFILPAHYPTIGSALELFGLPLAGYGTRLQMPMNAPPPQQP